MTYRSKKLSPQMRRSLRELLDKNNLVLPTTTRKSLTNRGLIDQESLLTEYGKKIAISLVSLERQCSELGLFLSKIDWHLRDSCPEKFALQYYADSGFIGARCEGGAILILIRAAVLDALRNLSNFRNNKDALTRATEAQLTIHNERISTICETILASTQSDVTSGFLEIYSSEFVRDQYPSLNEEVIISLYDALGVVKLAEITRALSVDPYSFRRGWPDLTLVGKEGQLMWVEVKTSDKLSYSQIDTISYFKKILPGKIGVLKLC